MRRIILHIDFDSFFASVEQQNNPELRNLPIGVTATNGRTCIIASSREAKRKGIKTGTRTFDAERLCPGIICVPANFVKYWDVSKKFLKVCNNFSPIVEVFSIDEVFMDVSLTTQLYSGNVYKLIETFKQKLAADVGEYITASVGISHNKLLAKLASGMRKPNGVMEIKEEDVIKVYNEAELTDICGIGPRIERRLNNMGIKTLIQLRLAPLSALKAEFGEVEGTFLKNVGLGIDKRPVLPYTEVDDVKSVGRNYCLARNEYDKRIVLQNVYELCEEVCIKLRRLGKKAKTAGVYLGGEPSISGRQTFAHYFDTGKEMFENCLLSLTENSPLGLADYGFYYLVQNAYEVMPSYTRQICVWVGNLEDADHMPVPMFTKEKKVEKVVKAVDYLNDKFGDHTIRNGFVLYANKLTTVPNGYGSDKYERKKLAVDPNVEA